MACPTFFEVTVLGPKGSPYEGGFFHLKIVLSDEFPTAPPEIVFLTRIFHPNIDVQGQIGLDILKPPPIGTWEPTNTIMSILKEIQALMLSPDPDRTLCSDIAHLYISNKELFENTAREWTAKYANCQLPPSVALFQSTNREGMENPRNEDPNIPSVGPSSSSAVECMEFDEDEGERNNESGLSSNPKRPLESDFAMEEDAQNKKPKLE